MRLQLLFITIESSLNLLQQSSQTSKLLLPHSNLTIHLVKVDSLIQFRRITLLLQQANILINKCYLSLNSLLLRIATFLYLALILLRYSINLTTTLFILAQPLLVSSAIQLVLKLCRVSRITLLLV